jgi:hypothetical protein
MTIDKEWTDLELARRIGFILCREAQRPFGRPFEGRLEDLLDRLLSAGAAVNPAAYNLAYILRARIASRH